MNDDTKQLIVYAVAFFGIVASMGACTITENIHDNNAMVEMVLNGADPLDANCAIKGGSSKSCLIRAATKNK